MKKINNIKGDGNILYIEGLRILACYLVIFNHTGGVGYSLFTQYTPGGKSFFLYLSATVFCKVAVFIFFAISGALLITKEETLYKTLKRGVRIAIGLMIFSFIYYIYEVYLGYQAFDLKVFMSVLYKDKWNPSFWYLYTYLGFIVCLPFLRALVLNMENIYFYYLFALGIVFNGMLPILKYFSDIFAYNKSFDIAWILDTIVLYPCLGYFMHNRFDIVKNKRVLPFLWLMNIVSISISCYATYYIGIKSGQEFTEMNSQSCIANFVVINCVTLFLTFKYVFACKAVSKFVSKMLISVGGCTYGIYMVHYWFEMKNPVLMYIRWNWSFEVGINRMIASCIDCFVILLMGYITTLIMKKIPLLRKFI